MPRELSRRTVLEPDWRGRRRSGCASLAGRFSPDAGTGQPNGRERGEMGRLSGAFRRQFPCPPLRRHLPQRPVRLRRRRGMADANNTSK